MVELPLGSDEEVREQYLSWRGTVRFGKLLEDADAFAGTVAFVHCDDGNAETAPQRLVTAAVERIDVRRPIPVDDMVLCGNVTWTGRSSLRVGMSLGRKEDAASASTSSPIRDPVLTASFVFVALSADGSPTQVNPLSPGTELERSRFEDGARAVARQRADRAASLDSTAPGDEESELIHRLLVSGRGGAGRAATSVPASPGVAAAAVDLSGPGDDCVLLSSTSVTTSTLTQPQERNTAGKVFGGFLCRKAFEAAHTAASLLALRSGVDCVPELVGADNITFDRPVEVGRLLTLSASVVYTGAEGDEGEASGSAGAGDGVAVSAGQMCHVRADATVLNMTTGEQTTSNAFHFTFLCSPGRSRSLPGTAGAGAGRTTLRPVRPETYADAMAFLDGRRRLRRSLSIGRSIGSALVPR